MQTGEALLIHKGNVSLAEKQPSLVHVNKTTGGEDYDRPTVLRNKNKAAQRAQATGGNSAEDMDYLDIPAFLRRQAD